MQLRIETTQYNEKRYGKPWIAKIDFESNKQGTFIWGDWIGTPGYEGLLELTVNTNDIVARGQKDTRKPRNSAPEFYKVNPDASLENIGSKGAAYKYFLSQQKL
jgi:hypothetical protein